MRFLVAPDSFKGTFDAFEVAAAIAAGVEEVSAADIARIGERMLSPRTCVAAALGPKPALKAVESFQRSLFGG